MGVAFYDADQKRLKLDRTICLYKGEPYFVVAEQARDNTVQLYELGEGFRRVALTVDYREDDFDYRAFALGYTNFNNMAVYVSRVPDRQNSQGLSAHCVTFRPGGSHYSTASWIQSRAAYDTIKGIYPSLEECLKEVHPYAQGKDSMAFDRYFAIRRWDNNMRLLCCRGRNVGYLDEGSVCFFKAKDIELIKVAARKVGVSC